MVSDLGSPGTQHEDTILIGHTAKGVQVYQFQTCTITDSTDNEKGFLLRAAKFLFIPRGSTMSFKLERSEAQEIAGSFNTTPFAPVIADGNGFVGALKAFLQDTGIPTDTALVLAEEAAMALQ